MGVSITHYVVLGVAITDEAQVKNFFRINEEHLEFMEGYDDNAYATEITPSESGIHVIVDGMSSKYVIVGKILSKSTDRYYFNEIGSGPGDFTIAQQYRFIYPEILKLDQVLGTKFGALYARVISFSHWH